MFSLSHPPWFWSVFSSSSMNLLKIQHSPHHPRLFSTPQTTLSNPSLPSAPHFLSLPLHGPLCASLLSPFPPTPITLSTPHTPIFKRSRVSRVSALAFGDELSYGGSVELEEDLAIDGEVYRETLRLVECSMFAAVGGLAYFLSTSLSIESYFGCFFALPIVISSLRWGVAAGRKTMVATAMLLLVLSGPVKALTYLLMHGLVGVTMGTLWRLQANWSLSIILCAFVRALGAVGCVLITSFLIRDNILALITVNIHASLSYINTTVGINAIPSMDMIYLIFGTLVVLNCGFFVFLLHILYALFFIRLGMKASLKLPRWLEKAI